MRRSCITIAVLLVLWLLRGQALALDLVVSANVPTNAPQLSTTILKITDGDPDKNPWTNSTVEQTLDFGQLTFLLSDNTNAGGFFSNTEFCVILFVEPFGKPFNILATCSGISGSGGALPVGSFGLVPVYSDTDKWIFPSGEKVQGDMPSGAKLGDPGPAVPGGTVYSSETGNARSVILQLYFTIPPFGSGGTLFYPGYVQIPLTQAPGKYSGTVTLTLSPK
ncbi:MAG: hypothetical protein ACM3OC_05725 [Deltaproteobacteria bacterium]